MDAEKLVQEILDHMGTRENVTSVMNCMTRLRVKVKDDNVIDREGLKAVDGVLGLVHDRDNYWEVVVGPGKSSRCGEVCRRMGIPGTGQDWKSYKASVQAAQKENLVRSALKIFGEIFVPLIPGVITSGLCAGLNILLQQIFPDWDTRPFLHVLCTLLGMINTSFLAYITAWTGYRAAERFGGTPILGGMLGLITGLDGIDTIAQTIGWWNSSSPLDSILHRGRGGILAVVFGVLVMVRAEKWIRSHLPASLDVVFTPLLTLLSCLLPYIFLIMPACGLLSSWICTGLQQVSLSPNPWVRILAGYLSAALFLPLVSMGMHHGLVALYTVQLEKLGYITLYPSLCMAGAGQVGASLAICLKAKKLQNHRLHRVISGALPAGILGVGEPLIYGVTLPMGKPFITAGLGAGFGGAFVMAMQVASTTWGTSGVLALFNMTAGPRGAVFGVLCYLAGLLLSCGAAFVITLLLLTEEDVQKA